MGKNFGTRKAFKGHWISDKELSDLAKEYASAIFHALAMKHPVRLVTLGETETTEKGVTLKETGAPFFTVASPKFDQCPKFTTQQELRKHLVDACGSVVTKLVEVWDTEHKGTPIYLLAESQVAIDKKEKNVEINVALHVAGAKKEETTEAPSETSGTAEGLALAEAK